MNNHEFTDDEIIKMLKSIGDVGDCSRDCIFYDGKVHHCALVVAHHALEVINRQKVEIESLKIANEKMYSANKEQKAVIEELSKTNKTLADTLIGRLNITVNIPEVEFKYMFPHHTCKRFKKGEANAVKEFADNVLQELWHMNWHYGQLPCSEEDKTTQRAIKKCIEVVKRKTKEMTEGNNE